MKQYINLITKGQQSTCFVCLKLQNLYDLVSEFEDFVSIFIQCTLNVNSWSKKLTKIFPTPVQRTMLVITLKPQPKFGRKLNLVWKNPRWRYRVTKWCTYVLDVSVKYDKVEKFVSTGSHLQNIAYDINSKLKTLSQLSFNKCFSFLPI